MGVVAAGWNENSRVASSILGQGENGASVYSPGGPEIEHYLSYGGSEFDRDRDWDPVGFTKFSQTETTIFEDNHEPLSTRKDGEHVYGLFNRNLSELSGWRVMAAPDMVKVGLTD